MSKILVYKNPNGDTRTAGKDVTFEQFQEANESHIQDVDAVMYSLATMVATTGWNHDYTKKHKEQEFYKDFMSTINEGTNFVEGDWYKYHIAEERHHLFSRCPDDVNLVDVLEMIADCVCAGLARSGEIRDLEIDSDILNRAVQNTVKMIVDWIEVVEGRVDEN